MKGETIFSKKFEQKKKIEPLSNNTFKFNL